MDLQRDVVVIGAGACGLTAATALRRAGLTVAVLEARDRVGGRLWTDTDTGALLELGGQWVSPDQTALQETVDELGLETLLALPRGRERLRRPRRRAAPLHRRHLPRVRPRREAEIERMIGVLDGLVAEVDPDEPWRTRAPASSTRITWRAFLEQLSDDAEARDNVALFIAEAMITKPAHAFSALQALLMAASAGSFSNLVDADFILDKRVVGGLQQVPERLAAALGDDVLLNRPVRTIERVGRRRRRARRRRPAWSAARRAIVAVPPNLYDRIELRAAAARSAAT